MTTSHIFYIPLVLLVGLVLGLLLGRRSNTQAAEEEALRAERRATRRRALAEAERQEAIEHHAAKAKAGEPANRP